ncbi:MAG: alpha/beta hydrolase [Chitinophaga sp.]|uniref:alpha/beta fold hydrolase n=1 Tax=Chitinophaga sp. TaxID=1869181 RepID=UPI0025C22055|nr:alpha/beta hydrolase [Chitinophaga sp.]MBV8252041.1 alpha/beta hydrolase [Chitinophaga sp.]
MANWQTRVCEANNIHIHYTSTGGNKPPVILLHGLMTDGLCWTPLARELEKDYDVIMPDARGHGQSSVPDVGYQYADLANDVIGLINVLRLQAPMLIGHSMGGMTAAVVAAHKPNLLRGVILADPTFLSPQMQQTVHESDIADQHQQMLEKPLEEVMAAARARHPHRSAELIELYSKARLQTSMKAFEVLTPPNPDFKQLVRKINIPSLLVLGDKGVVTSVVAEELQQLNPGMQIAQIAEAGHSLHIDQAARFTAIVKHFLGAI